MNIAGSSDQGQQHCVIYYLKEGAAAEYDRLHASVWPEIRSTLRENGVFDYSIFRRGDLVIGVYRTHPGAESTSTNSSTSDVQARWSELMRSLFDRSVDDRGEDLTATRIFRMDD